MIDLYLLSTILFIVIVAILVYKDRKNMEFKFPLLLRRTKKFRGFIKSIANASPTLWKVVYTIAIIVCIYFMIQGTYILLSVTSAVASGELTEPGIKLILPTPTATAQEGPGYILIPFWFWIFVIFIILVPHELSHGIISVAEKIKLKSVGLFLLLLIPGAFVEPDEKQLKKAKPMKRLRVFAAGSFANFVVAFLVLGLLMFVVWPAAVSPGVEITSVNESSPAEIAGLLPGMIITSINGNSIQVTYQEFVGGGGYFVDELGDPEPGDTVLFVSGRDTYKVELGDSEGKAYMGINYSHIINENFLFARDIVPLLNMIWLFSFFVGLFNILPIYPLDGGRMVETIIEKFSQKRAKQITMGITYIMVFIILYNVFGPYI